MMQNELAHLQQEKGTEREGKRLENLMDVYNNFANYLNPEFVLEQQKLGQTIPWDVRFDEEKRIMDVRYSEDFAKKYQLNIREVDPPIFRFHLDSQYRPSYDQLKSPFDRVEINIVTDSAFVDQFSKDSKKTATFDHWEFSIENENAKLLKKPNKFLINESEFDTNLKKLTHFNVNEFDRSLEKILVTEKLSPFAKNLVQIGKDLIRETNFDVFKTYSDTLKLSVPKLTPKEIKVINTVYRVVEQSSRKEETKAYSFLFDYDKAQKRNKLATVGAIIAASLTTAGAFPLFNMLSFELQKEDQVYTPSYDSIAKNFENQALHSSVNLLKTLDILGNKWNIEPDVFGDRYFSHLDAIVETLKLVSEGKISTDFLKEKFEFSPNLKDVVNNPSYIVALEDTYPGDTESFKAFFLNLLKVFPFLSSVVKEIDLVRGQSGLREYYYNQTNQNYETELLIPPPFGQNWDNASYQTLSTVLHELTHGLRKVSVAELKNYLSIEDYCEVLNLQLNLSNEVIENWIAEGGNRHYIQDSYLFSDWMFNYDGTNNESFIQMATDFHYDKINYFDSDVDYEVNSFMYWALTKYRWIKDKQRNHSETMTSEEYDFLDKYHKYQIGNKAVAHVCHHLESFLPFNPNDNQPANLEAQRNQLFSLICRKFLDKTDKEVLRDVETKILGSRVDTSLPQGVENFKILSVFDVNNVSGIYNNKGELKHIIRYRGNQYIGLYVVNTPVKGKTYLYLPFSQSDELTPLPLSDFAELCVVDNDYHDLICLGITNSGEITSNNRWSGFEVEKLLDTDEFTLERKNINVTNLKNHDYPVVVAKTGDKEYYFTNCNGGFDTSKLILLSDGSAFIKYTDGTFEFDLQSRSAFGEIAGLNNSQRSLSFNKDENGFSIEINGERFYVEGDVYDAIGNHNNNFPGKSIRYRLVKVPNSDTFKYEIFIIDGGTEKIFNVLEKEGKG